MLDIFYSQHKTLINLNLSVLCPNQRVIRLIRVEVEMDTKLTHSFLGCQYVLFIHLTNRSLSTVNQSIRVEVEMDTKQKKNHFGELVFPVCIPDK